MDGNGWQRMATEGNGSEKMQQSVIDCLEGIHLSLCRRRDSSLPRAPPRALPSPCVQPSARASSIPGSLSRCNWAPLAVRLGTAGWHMPHDVHVLLSMERHQMLEYVQAQEFLPQPHAVRHFIRESDDCVD